MKKAFALALLLLFVSFALLLGCTENSQPQNAPDKNISASPTPAPEGKAGPKECDKTRAWCKKPSFPENDQIFLYYYGELEKCREYLEESHSTISHSLSLWRSGDHSDAQLFCQQVNLLFETADKLNVDYNAFFFYRDCILIKGKERGCGCKKEQGKPSGINPEKKTGLEADVNRYLSSKVKQDCWFEKIEKIDTYSRDIKPLYQISARCKFLRPDSNEWYNYPREIYVDTNGYVYYINPCL
ncbi:MAG: hypothetical protein V1493_00630 [Candidatus Diapherotrites archaeon]